MPGYQQGDYKSSPKGDIGKAMAAKDASISKFQKHKDDSMRLFAASRDASLMLTDFNRYQDLNEDQLKAKWQEWRKFFYTQLDVPFI